MSDTPRSGRETRLLALVILVAIAALLVLARFRFPEAADRAPVAPPPGPLERLAARASFQDLATSIAGLHERLSPGFVMVEVAPAPPAKPSTTQSASARRGRSSTPEVRAEITSRFHPALRVRPDRALVFFPAGSRVVAIDGIAEEKPDVAVDQNRPLALVRVPVAPEAAALLAGGLETFAGLAYVALFEGGRGGVSPRPQYLGRVDAMADAVWPSPPLVIGGHPELVAGTYVFAFDGRLLGIVLPTSLGTAIVPARALQSIVTAWPVPQGPGD